MLSSIEQINALKEIYIMNKFQINQRYSSDFRTLKPFALEDNFKCISIRRFWKYYDKSRNSIFTLFSTLFTDYTCIDREFPYICLDMFKVICCRFVVWWKWLTGDILIKKYFTLYKWVRIARQVAWNNRYLKRPNVE